MLPACRPVIETPPGSATVRPSAPPRPAAWFVVPAYQQATAGNYAPLRELQDVMTRPYAEQSKDVEEKYYSLKPSEFFDVGGLSYYSCSS